MLYDEQTGFYYDRKIESEHGSKNSCADGDLLRQRGMGSEAFTMLWSGAADQEKAKRVIHQLKKK
jgi:neutral trehalase